MSGGLNQYVFCGNNPVSNIDPFGLDWLDALASGAAGMGDVVSFGVTKGIRDGNSWFYGDTDTSATSYKVGVGLGIAHGVAMGGAGIAKGVARTVAASTRGKLYEIGSQTLRGGKYKGLVARNGRDVVRIGIDRVRQEGWRRASIPSTSGVLLQSWKTVWTGVTPLVREGIGEVGVTLYGAGEMLYGAYARGGGCE